VERVWSETDSLQFAPESVERQRRGEERRGEERIVMLRTDILREKRRRGRLHYHRSHPAPFEE